MSRDPLKLKTKDEQVAFLREAIIAHVRAEYGKELNEANQQEIWIGLAKAVMEIIAPRWEKSRKSYATTRQAHYLSAEFLVGRSLTNNLLNLGIYDAAKEVCAELGHDLADLEEEETDPGLGNGGLGRLAACFLDSSTTLEYPVNGYGILYRYGLFKQNFENGFQKEYPDAWMERDYPFISRREELACTVSYQDLEVYAVPYDLPITGYGTKNINVLRLWKPEPLQEFDYNLFNSQRFDDAVIERNRVQDINRVLYPNDSSYDGKVLRVRQQYFFVSASLQSVIQEYQRYHGNDFSKFADYHVFQLNDTHPVFAIPELMRLLMDEHGLSWDEAWQICHKCFAYTNHTILAEALEKWEISIAQFLFPRILEIIRQIDQQFREEARSRGLQAFEIEAMAPIHDNRIHMASLAVYTAFKINGVAKLHSQILKDETLHSYYELWPNRFTNKTNGVTPRRWLYNSNQDLSDLLTELLGSDAWVTDLDQLQTLEKYKTDASVLDQLQKIKNQDKQRLAAYLNKNFAMQVDPEALFDVQVKRLHEYKRQLLNAFEILDRYNRIKAGQKVSDTPVAYIFGAKSAPSYFRAKAIIKFINELAKKVNQDPEVNQLMRVHFIPNYNVSKAELIFPASNISEQISTVGKEASGTGNMKFMMNGALTLGTWDGANLEIAEAVGEENAFMFGTHLKDFPATLDFYNSQWQYANIEGLKPVVDSLMDGTFDDANSGMFAELYRSLLKGSPSERADVYYVLGDFKDYRNRRFEAHEAFQAQETWLQKSWINICNSGRFSSDRTIQDYVDEIWHLDKQQLR